MRMRGWAIVLTTMLLASTIGGVSRAADPVVPGRIAFVRDGGIWVWENGETTRLLREADVSDARWSPDGQSLLFVRSGNSYSELALLTSQTGVVTLVTPGNQSTAEVGSELYANESIWALDPAWSRSGRIAYVSDEPRESGFFTLWLMDGTDGEPYQAPLLVAEDNIDSVSLSGDGALAAYVVRERDPDTGASDIGVWLRDLGSGETFLIAQSRGEVFDPAISPDGQTIAVAIREPDGPTDVWLVDRATLERTRVTRDLEALAPTWSSDGAWVSFLKLQDFQFEVWVAPVSNGDAGEPFKLFSAKGVDSRSGLSWTVGAPEGT